MTENDPLLSRRLLLAASLAAIVAGGATALASFGAISAPGTETFRFSRGTALAAGEEARLKGFLAPALQDDRLRVVIVGHSGMEGESPSNLELSEKRAASAQGIALEMGIAAERVIASGVGAGAPLPREAGQPDDVYEARLARVEVTLQVRR